MASAQCYKITEQTSSYQTHQNHSLGHKVADMTDWALKPAHATAQTHSKTQTHCVSGNGHSHGHDKGQFLGLAHGHHSDHGHQHDKGQFPGLGHGHHSSHTWGGSVCHGKATGEHKKKGLFQKIKDGISGDTSCSSSDSETDNECGRAQKKR